MVRSIILELQFRTADQVDDLIRSPFDTIFGTQDMHDSLLISNLKRKGFNRQKFGKENNIENIQLDQFCLRFRTEICLRLYPDRIE